MPDIEEHIQKAIREGAFEDLPGKGKPLRLEDNPHADPDWRLAHHVLHNSGFSLPWIALRQEIEAELEAARAALRRAWVWRQTQGRDIQAAESEWQRAQSAFAENLARINKQIDDYNLQTPSEKFQMIKLKLARELAAVTITG